MMTLTFGAGLLLLPFSTPAGAGSYVISFGLPLLAIVALAYAGARLHSPRVRRENVVPAIAAILLLSAITIGTIYSPFMTASLARWAPNVIGALLFGYVLSEFFHAREPGIESPYERLVAGYIISATIIGGYFLIVFWRAVGEVGLAGVFVDRVVGGVISLPWGATNVIASPMILPVLLTYGMRTGNRRVWSVCRLVLIAAIALTLSRGAIGAMVAGLALLFVLAPPLRWQLAAHFGLVSSIVIAADVWSGGLLHEQLWEPFAQRLVAPDLTTLNERLPTWEVYSSSIANHPLLGLGYYASLGTFGFSAHSILLTTLAERGIVGTFLSSIILWLSGAAALNNWSRARYRTDRVATAALLAGGAASMLHLLVEDANLTQPYAIYSWLALALPFLWQRAQAAEPGSKETILAA